MEHYGRKTGFTGVLWQVHVLKIIVSSGPCLSPGSNYVIAYHKISPFIIRTNGHKCFIGLGNITIEIPQGSPSITCK